MRTYDDIVTIGDYGMGLTEERPDVPTPHLSNSQRVGYSICPTAHHFERVEKQPGTRQSDSLRGTVTHGGLAAAFVAYIQGADRDACLAEGRKRIGEILQETLGNMIKPPRWIKAFHAFPRYTDGPLATLQSIGEDALAALPVAFDAIVARFQPISVEHGFAIHWKPTAECPDPLPTVGFIDLLVMHRASGKVGVLDFKSGNKKKSLSDLISDDAVVLYAPAAETILRVEVEWLTYLNIVFSKSGVAVHHIGIEGAVEGLDFPALPYDPDRVRRAATHQHALQLQKERGIVLPMETGWSCNRCPHMTACQTRFGASGITQDLHTLEYGDLEKIGLRLPAGDEPPIDDEAAFASLLQDVAEMDAELAAAGTSLAPGAAEPDPTPSPSNVISLADHVNTGAASGEISPPCESQGEVEEPPAEAVEQPTKIMTDPVADDAKPPAAANEKPAAPWVATISEAAGRSPDGTDFVDPQTNPVLAALAAQLPGVSTWPRTARQAVLACEARGKVVSTAIAAGATTYSAVIKVIEARIASGETDAKDEEGALWDLRRHLATLRKGAQAAAKATAA